MNLLVGGLVGDFNTLRLMFHFGIGEITVITRILPLAPGRRDLVLSSRLMVRMGSKFMKEFYVR